MKGKFFLMLVLAVGVVLLIGDVAEPGVVATIPVGDAPIGVAVNPTTNRIYAVNSWAYCSVSVIDGETNTELTTVDMGAYPLYVAVNPSTNRIYVTDCIADNVWVIDGATDTVVVTIPVGGWPHGVAINLPAPTASTSSTPWRTPCR